jgi:hypothetical protein
VRDPRARARLRSLQLKIIGHGIEAGGSMFCCAHCAERSGLQGARDRVEA